MKKLDITFENAQKAYQKGCREVKDILINLFGDIFEEEFFCKLGDKFHYGEFLDASAYMIVSCGEYMVVLVDTATGCRIGSPQRVHDLEKITKKEFNSLIDYGYNSEKFYKLK